MKKCVFMKAVSAQVSYAKYSQALSNTVIGDLQQTTCKEKYRHIGDGTLRPDAPEGQHSLVLLCYKILRRRKI